MNITRQFSTTMSENPNKNVICCYENCEGFPQSLLEKCQNGSCPNLLHHMCQTAFEHRERLTLPLSKKCQKCLEEEVMGGTLPEQKKQKGFMNCSVVLCPRVYYFGNWDALANKSEEDMSNMPFVFAKIISVPRPSIAKKTFELQYDRIGSRDVSDLDRYTNCLPDLDAVRKLLREAVARADRKGYRFNGNKNRRKKKITELPPKKKSRKASSEPAIDSETLGGGSISSLSTNVGGLLSGILSEINNNPSSTMNSPSANTYVNDNILINDSDSDEESHCDINESAFHVDVHDKEEEEDEKFENVEDELDVLGEDWKWDQWEDIGDEDSIPGPLETDHYNGPHGIREHVATSFQTILQCIFSTTAMDRDFFKRLATQSNKYARTKMHSQSSSMFLGHKWENISVGEMVRFFGIMLRISMEPRKMGGYTSYFQENPLVNLASGYSVQLRGFDPWAKEVMPLIRFKQIRGAFHPEAGLSMCGDKCHQLRYFIRRFNEKAKQIFHLGPNASFDEGGIAMRSRYCPVRQYNKDKPNKYRVDFFILADASFYFIYHLDVYQGKNINNIDVHEQAAKLPTTQKAVANAILKSEINNDPNGSRHIFMDNRYTAPQLLALMLTNWNLRGVGTCRANRKGFASKELELDKSSTRGSFVRKVDKRLGMVITRWKDSKILQTVSTVMCKGLTEITRRTGPKKIRVAVPNDIEKYQNWMGGVDRGDQHRVMGAGFSNVAHFKKWYKKAYLGIADFSMLNAFSAWNLSVNYSGVRGGTKSRHRLVKWEFYAVAAEELMSYVDVDELKHPTCTNVHNASTLHRPGVLAHSNNPDIRPTCAICNMEESVLRKIFNVENKKGRKYSRRQKYLATCTHPDCKISAHVCCPDGTKTSLLPMFRGMSCFDIAHSQECQNMFTTISRNGKDYIRTVPSHKVAKDLEELYQQDLPRRSSRGRPRLVQEEEEEEAPHTPPTLTTNRRSIRNSTPPPTNKSPARKRSPSEMTPPRPRSNQRKKLTRTRVSRRKRKSSNR